MPGTFATTGINSPRWNGCGAVSRRESSKPGGFLARRSAHRSAGWANSAGSRTTSRTERIGTYHSTSGADDGRGATLFVSQRNRGITRKPLAFRADAGHYWNLNRYSTGRNQLLGSIVSLIPWLRRNYNVTRDPQRVTIGPSRQQSGLADSKRRSRRSRSRFPQPDLHTARQYFSQRSG